MNFHLALLGKGKTGGKVQELHPGPTTVFDRQTPIKDLDRFDVAISFWPGEAFEKAIPLLIESKIPVIVGSTGFSWPSTLDQVLKEKKRTWIKASNFSLGMGLVRNLLKTVSAYQKILKNMGTKIHEIHHQHKQDAPSGTALSWQSWLGQDVPITSERTGDIQGIHQLTLSLPSEEISLEHKALDRSIFAQGALWAAKRALSSPTLPAGLLDFHELLEKELYS